MMIHHNDVMSFFNLNRAPTVVLCLWPNMPLLLNGKGGWNQNHIGGERVNYL